MSRNFDTISVRDETSNFRNIRFNACLTEFRLIHNCLPISGLVNPLATRLAICISLGVRRLKYWFGTTTDCFRSSERRADHNLTFQTTEGDDSTTNWLPHLSRGIQLDVMSAYQVLAFPPNTQVHLIWKTLTPIVSNESLTFTPTVTLADCPPLNVICVPGGSLGQIKVMKDPEILDFLQQQSKGAQYVTSVCTGSMILAAAGVLQGYKATCHWAFRDQLAMLGVEVMPQRVVIDSNHIIGAGVTSGIDFGLTLLGLLCGEEIAKMAQLMMEYIPDPPFDAGVIETAGEEVVQPFMQLGKPIFDAFLDQTKDAANQLKMKS